MESGTAQTVLLAGASGMLGSRIAQYLLGQPNTRTRLLVRDRNRARSNPTLAPFLDAGCELVEGDLADPDSLKRATQNVNVIVSAVQGGPDVIIEGQVALAEAAQQNGVRRIIPSDFALDLFKRTPGEHMMFDIRAKADERIREIGLEQVNILQGAFMEVFLPGKGAVDLEAGQISFFGDGDRPIEVTSVNDTARMVARVAVDRDVPAGKFAFAADHISFRQAGEIISQRTGRPCRPVSLGSEADLRTKMAAAEPQQKVMLGYLLYMTNGQTALSNLQNGRYADLKFRSFPDYVAHNFPDHARA